MQNMYFSNQHHLHLNHCLQFCANRVSQADERKRRFWTACSLLLAAVRLYCYLWMSLSSGGVNFNSKEALVTWLIGLEVMGTP
jgi:hypothetical protein